MRHNFGRDGDSSFIVLAIDIDFDRTVGRGHVHRIIGVQDERVDFQLLAPLFNFFFI